MEKNNNDTTSLSFWNRIKFKLLVFGIIMSIVPITIFGWYNIEVTKLSLEENIQEKQIYVAQRAASEVNDLLTSIQERMTLLINVNDTKNMDEQAKNKWEQTLYGFLKQNTEIENAYVFDESGHITSFASRWNVEQPEKITNIQYKKFKNKLEIDKTYVVSEVYFKADGSPNVNMGFPFYSPDKKKFYGGMMIEVSLRSTFKKVSSILTGKNGYVYIIDDQARLIAHTDFSQVLREQNVIASRALETIISSEDYHNTPQRYTSYTGKDVIGIYESIPLTDWGVVIEQPVEKAYLSIDLLVKRLFMTTLIFASLVVIVSIVFGIRFTKPIELMEKAVEKVTKGKLDAKIETQSSDEFGKLAAAFNHMTDELKIKSESLEQEKERLDTIINGSGAGFALVYDNYTVSWMNSRLKEWLNVEGVGLSCFGMLGNTEEPCKDCPIALNNANDCQNEVVSTFNKTGVEKMFRHRMYPLERVKEGEPQYLIVVEDITEQRKLEDKVVQVDKLSALGILASGFAHEVNNPLASISAYAEDLKERLKEESPDELIQSGEANFYLDTIRNNVERCKRITNSLLNFSRKPTFTNKQINLGTTIENSLILMEHTFKKNDIELVKNIEIDLPNVLGDETQIQQVFVNLMQNSIDAMDGKGRLEIFTNHKDEMIEVHFKDNGSGMTKEQINKVFDPFYTTKPVGKGTGLGLYISYNIMKKLNGDIIINSQEKIGTDVIVVFSISE